MITAGHRLLPVSNAMKTTTTMTSSVPPASSASFLHAPLRRSSTSLASTTTVTCSTTVSAMNAQQAQHRSQYSYGDSSDVKNDEFQNDDTSSVEMDEFLQSRMDLVLNKSRDWRSVSSCSSNRDEDDDDDENGADPIQGLGQEPHSNLRVQIAGESAPSAAIGSTIGRPQRHRRRLVVRSQPCSPSHVQEQEDGEDVCPDEPALVKSSCTNSSKPEHSSSAVSTSLLWTASLGERKENQHKEKACSTTSTTRAEDHSILDIDALEELGMEDQESRVQVSSVEEGDRWSISGEAHPPPPPPPPQNPLDDDDDDATTRSYRTPSPRYSLRGRRSSHPRVWSNHDVDNNDKVAGPPPLKGTPETQSPSGSDTSSAASSQQSVDPASPTASINGVLADIGNDRHLSHESGGGGDPEKPENRQVMADTMDLQHDPSITDSSDETRESREASSSAISPSSSPSAASSSSTSPAPAMHLPHTPYPQTPPMYNPYSNYSPSRPRRTEIMGMSLFSEAAVTPSLLRDMVLLTPAHNQQQQQNSARFSSGVNNKNNMSNRYSNNNNMSINKYCALLDSDEALERYAAEMRKDLRQAEMLELAAAAEQAADSGQEKFSARPSTYRHDDNDDDDDDDIDAQGGLSDPVGGPWNTPTRNAGTSSYSFLTPRIYSFRGAVAAPFSSSSRWTMAPRSSPQSTLIPEPAAVEGGATVAATPRRPLPLRRRRTWGGAVVADAAPSNSSSRLSSRPLSQRLYHHYQPHYPTHSIVSTPLYHHRCTTKLGVLELRDVQDVVPSFTVFHTHLRTHFARNRVKERTLVFDETPQPAPLLPSFLLPTPLKAASDTALLWPRHSRRQQQVQPPDDDEDERRRKMSGGYRFGRDMDFWVQNLNFQQWMTGTVEGQPTGTSPSVDIRHPRLPAFQVTPILAQQQHHHHHQQHMHFAPVTLESGVVAAISHSPSPVSTPSSDLAECRSFDSSLYENTYFLMTERLAGHSFRLDEQEQQSFDDWQQQRRHSRHVGKQRPMSSSSCFPKQSNMMLHPPKPPTHQLEVWKEQALAAVCSDGGTVSSSVAARNACAPSEGACDAESGSGSAALQAHQLYQQWKIQLWHSAEDRHKTNEDARNHNEDANNPKNPQLDPKPSPHEDAVSFDRSADFFLRSSLSAPEPGALGWRNTVSPRALFDDDGADSDDGSSSMMMMMMMKGSPSQQRHRRTHSHRSDFSLASSNGLPPTPDRRERSRTISPIPDFITPARLRNIRGEKASNGLSTAVAQKQDTSADSHMIQSVNSVVECAGSPMTILSQPLLAELSQRQPAEKAKSPASAGDIVDGSMTSSLLLPSYFQSEADDRDNSHIVALEPPTMLPFRVSSTRSSLLTRPQSVPPKIMTSEFASLSWLDDDVNCHRKARINSCDLPQVVIPIRRSLADLDISSLTPIPKVETVTDSGDESVPSTAMIQSDVVPSISMTQPGVSSAVEVSELEPKKGVDESPEERKHIDVQTRFRAIVHPMTPDNFRPPRNACGSLLVGHSMSIQIQPSRKSKVSVYRSSPSSYKNGVIDRASVLQHSHVVTFTPQRVARGTGRGYAQTPHEECGCLNLSPASSAVELNLSNIVDSHDGEDDESDECKSYSRKSKYPFRSLRRSASAGALNILGEPKVEVQQPSMWNPFAKEQKAKRRQASSSPCSDDQLSPTNSFHAAMTMLRKLSPTNANRHLANHRSQTRNRCRRALYVRAQENDDFVHNYLYCSKPGDRTGVPLAAMSEPLMNQTFCAEPCHNTGLPCVDVNQEGCCALLLGDAATAILPHRRPHPSSRQAVSLSKSGSSSKLEAESWFDRATERFDVVLEHLSGSSNRSTSSPWNLSFQAPSLKKHAGPAGKPDSESDLFALKLLDVIEEKKSSEEDGFVGTDEMSHRSRSLSISTQPLFDDPDQVLSDQQFQVLDGMTGEHITALSAASAAPSLELTHVSRSPVDPIVDVTGTSNIASRIEMSNDWVNDLVKSAHEDSSNSTMTASLPYDIASSNHVHRPR